MATGDEPTASGQTSAAPSAALVASIRHLLRPLVRGLIASGIDFPYLANLLKRLYVEVASGDAAATGTTLTDSRVSLLTGVHRKEVRRLRSTTATAPAVPPRASLNAQIIACWLGSPEYLDADLRPLPLRRQSDRKEPTFDGLVASLSTDIRPRSVLDEWLRLGLARIDEEGRVQLNVTAYVPREGFDDLAFYFGRNLHDHLAASTHNLQRKGEPFLERAVYYDRLTPEMIAKLKEIAASAGTEALLAVNRVAAEESAKGEHDPAARRRMSFGIYFYDAEETPNDTPGE